MKKLCLLVIVVLFVMSLGVAAGTFNFVGGTSISKVNFTDTITEDNSTYKDVYDRNNVAGQGYNAGVRYFLGNGLGFGVGYETNSYGLSREKDNTTYPDGTKYIDKDYFTYKISGAYLEMVYKLKKYLSMRGAVSFNNLVISNDEYYYDNTSGTVHTNSYNHDTAKGDGTGYQLGAELDYPLSDKFNLVSNISYMFGNIDLKKVYNDSTKEFEKVDGYNYKIEYNGFKLGIGLNYSF